MDGAISISRVLMMIMDEKSKEKDPCLDPRRRLNKPVKAAIEAYH